MPCTRCSSFPVCSIISISLLKDVRMSTCPLQLKAQMAMRRQDWTLKITLFCLPARLLHRPSQRRISLFADSKLLNNDRHLVQQETTDGPSFRLSSQQNNLAIVDSTPSHYEGVCDVDDGSDNMTKMIPSAFLSFVLLVYYIIPVVRSFFDLD